MNPPPESNPFWLLKQLAGSKKEGLLPDLIIPDKDGGWTDSDGKRVRGKDGWLTLWHAIVSQFAPHANSLTPPVESSRSHPRPFLPAGAARTYEPANEKQWLGTLDDDEIPKRKSEALTRYQVERYRATCDVAAWGLRCTLDYWRHRFNSRHAGRIKRLCVFPPAFFTPRPRSQMACKHLAKWFFQFANARRDYHAALEAAVKVPKHAPRPRSDTAKSAIGKRVGPPKKVRLSERADQDLWLILVWPIAQNYRWTYKDVVRAVRLHFDVDALGRPAPEATAEEWDAVFRELSGSEGGTELAGQSPPLNDRQKAALRVSRSDAESVRLRCKRLGLTKLCPKARDLERVPPFFNLAIQFTPKDFSARKFVGDPSQ